MYTDLIDLHSHILPSLDDGPRNLKQSLAMARMAHHDGIRTIITTPHFYESKSRGLMSKRLDAISSLRTALAEHQIDLEILPGFEINATHSLLNRRSFGSLTLAGTQWILLEMPYVYGDEFEAVFDACIDEGLRPLIAHPERYPYFTADFSVLARLIEQGAWAQISVNAITGANGPEEQHWSLRALDMSMAHIVATDMHHANSDAPHLQNAIAILYEHLGAKKTDEIIRLNPARLLGRRL